MKKKYEVNPKAFQLLRRSGSSVPMPLGIVDFTDFHQMITYHAKFRNGMF